MSAIHCHLSRPSYVAYTPSFFSIFTSYQPFSSPPLSLFLSLQLNSICLHFSLSLKQFPLSVLFPSSLCPLQPATLFPPRLPSAWQGHVAMAFGSCRTRLTAQHLSPRDISQTKPPSILGQQQPLPFATPKPVHTPVQLAEGGEGRERWAAGLYAFIRAQP